MKKIYSWLNATHDFSNEEGEIKLTGWQYLKFMAIAAIAAIFLSISY